MKSAYKARYQDSYNYSLKYSLPWLESQGFKILSDEEKYQGNLLDKKYSVDYTAIAPNGHKVAIMMRNNEYVPSYRDYNFIIREQCMKTNNLREYYRLSSTYQNWENSKIYKEFGIQDYIFVQTYCNRVNDIRTPRAYAWTNYKNLIDVIDMGKFERSTVGMDKPATMLLVKWKDLRINGFDINMSIYQPNRAEYSPQKGLIIFPSNIPL